MSGSAPQPSDEEANLPGWPPLGRLLVDGGLVSEAQLDQALAEQRRHGARLGDIVLAKGWVSRLALASAVAHQHGLELSVTAEAEKLPKAALKPGTWKPLGQLLIDRGLITHMQLQQTIAEQRTTGHRLGEILVARNWLTPIMLMRVLDEQQGLGLAEQSLDVRASSSEEPTEQYDVEQKRDGLWETVHTSPTFFDATDVAFELLEHDRSDPLRIVRVAGDQHEQVWFFDPRQSASESTLDVFGYSVAAWDAGGVFGGARPTTGLDPGLQIGVGR